jgi:transposase-like protein
LSVGDAGSREEKQRLVAESARPERTVSQIARAHGVAPNLLFTWRRQFLAAAVARPGASAGFVPVRLAEEGPASLEAPTCSAVVAAAYDATKLRNWLAERRCEAIIPPNPTRSHPATYDPNAYKGCNVIERMFCRLKDFRRIATRYDKRADTFLSSLLIAATLIWWLNWTPRKT